MVEHEIPPVGMIHCAIARTFKQDAICAAVPYTRGSPGFSVDLPVDGIGDLVVTVCSKDIDRCLLPKRGGPGGDLGDWQSGDGGGEEKLGEAVLAGVVEVEVCSGVAGTRLAT